MFRTMLYAAIGSLIWMSRCTSAESPDVLMIIVDDLRPMLGCYGDLRISTPNIDRLARRGVVFEHAYCQYAKCGTSRLSLLTGLRPDAIGVYSNNVRDVDRFRQRRPDATSLPRWLKQHGYRTQSFGKIYHDGWDVADDWSVPSSPGRPGEMLEIVDEDNVKSGTIIAERFDCPVMQSPDVTDDHLFAGRMTKQVLSVLGQSFEMPRFLAVGYRRPHLPFVAPQRYYDRYQPDESWLPSNPRPPQNSPVMAWFNSDGYVGGAKRVGLTMPSRPDRRQAMDWNGYEMRSYLGVPNRGSISVKTQLQLLHAYAACVSYVDAQVGRLLEGLDKSENGDNTVIVFCSDHGWHLGEHSAWGKMTNFEIATRVPLMIVAPGVPPGRTRTVAELVDLYPTLCDLTGIPQPPHLQGESLRRTLLNPAATDVDSQAISQYSRFRDAYLGTAVRTLRHRFVRWVDTKTGTVVHRELYDHENDAGEHDNVADVESQELIQQLELRLAN